MTYSNQDISHFKASIMTLLLKIKQDKATFKNNKFVFQSFHVKTDSYVQIQKNSIHLLLHTHTYIHI